jgi:2'-phosphotransferase
MSRNHVHFASGYPGDKGVISGMRKTCDIYIELDLAKALADGLVFYLSHNGVILSAGINGTIPTKYFKRVTDANNRIIEI